MSSSREGDDTAQRKKVDPRSSFESDSGFTTTRRVAEISSPDHPEATSPTAVVDTTFMQNKIALSRNPSAVNSELSRQLSLNSERSYDAGLSASTILAVLSNDAASRPSPSSPASPGLRKDGGLSKSSSNASRKSASTLKSVKSAQSVPALGAHPLGSLRIHDADRFSTSPAAEYLKSGDIVLINGLPAGTFFGYDTIALSIGKDMSFEGIRDFPPGPHFIFGGSTSEVSTRNGFWIMSESRSLGHCGEVFVKHWDRHNEIIVDEISSAEVRNQTESVASMFDKLLPYTTEAAAMSNQMIPATGSSEKEKEASIRDPRMWQRLTCAIKGSMLNRITRQSWNKWEVSSTDDCQPAALADRARDATAKTRMKEAEDCLERLGPSQQKLKFIFPNTTRTFSEDVTGRARTEQAMDTSAHIAAVIEDRCSSEDSDEVIGELQYCYIVGMLLGSIACQQQWAHIIRIVFRAFKLAVDMPVFFKKVIQAVHAQLIYDEEGVEGTIFDHDPNLQDDLKHLLTVFKRRLNEQLLGRGLSLTDDQEKVGKAFEELEAWLWKWGWDLRGNYVRSGKIQLEDGEYVDAELEEFEAEDERGEYAPVIVDLEADGREKGLIRW